MATLAIMTIVSGLGLETGAVYFISSHRWYGADALRQLSLAALLLGAVGAAVGVGIAAMLSDTAFRGVGPATLVIGLAALPFALSWIFTSHVELARGRYRTAAVAPLLQGVSGLVLVATLAPAYGLWGALAGVTGSHALAAIVVFVRSTRLSEPPSANWLTSATRQLTQAIRFGFRASSTAILSLVNQRADLLILNAYAAHVVVGQYSLALSLTSLQLLVPYSLSRLVIPRIASLHSPSAAASRAEITTRAVRHAFVLAITSALAMSAGLLLVPSIFGAGFTETVRLGWILIPGTAALGVANVIGATVTGRGKPGSLLKVAAVVTPITLGFYFALVPSMHASGAAVASTLSYTMTLAGYWLCFRAATGITGVGSLLPGRDDLTDYWRLLNSLLKEATRTQPPSDKH
jgi:O-antigen/teichoic acid export membrane protein